MMSKLLRNPLWLSMTFVLLIMTACGEGDPASEAPGDGAADDPAGDGVAGAGEASGDLSVVITWSGSELEAFQAVIDGFSEANPDVNVELVNIPFGELNAQLTQQFASGSGPDVTVALPGLIRLFAGQEFLMPLDDLWDGWMSEGQYNQSLRDIASVDDTAYGVWFKGNVNALIWHKPARLEELGVEAPQTWDEWIDHLDTIKAQGDVEPLAVGGADSWPLSQWWDPILTRVAGADVHAGLVDGSVGWDDERVVEAFEVFGEFIADYFPPDTLDRGFVEATCAWVDDLAVEQNQGAFVNLVARGECDDSLVPGEDFTFFVMPPYDDAAPLAANISGDLFAVAADTDNPNAALALASYLGSAEAQSIWAELGGFVAPNASVSLDVYPDENDRRAAELWPRDDDAVAAYDLDDFIGGQIQSTLFESLQQFVRDQDVDAIVETMVDVDQQVRGG